jgi:hypothetical protein
MSAEHIQSLLRQARALSPDERVELIKDLQDSLTADREASHSQFESREENKRTDYLALFGSGRGGFLNAQEADEFIRQERDAWDN